MKALITGGNGFIGTHLVLHLLEEGYDVVIVDQRTNNQAPITDVPYYTCDIRDDSLGKILKNERPDTIFHLAAQSSVPISMNNPYQDAMINVLGTINILDNAVRYNVPKIIFASSAAVYGIPSALPINEAHPVRPTSFYGLSKAIGEDYIKMYKDNDLIDYTILRFANVYGPGQQMSAEAGLITKIVNSAFNNQMLSIYGDGSQTRDFIYVKDIVSACEKAIRASGTFNISNNTEISINHIIQHIESLLNRTMPIQYTAQRTGDIANSCLDNQLAKTRLFWKPDYSIIKGLMHTLYATETTVAKGG